jgi:hypothetical protein
VVKIVLGPVNTVNPCPALSSIVWTLQSSHWLFRHGANEDNAHVLEICKRKIGQEGKLGNDDNALRQANFVYRFIHANLLLIFTKSHNIYKGVQQQCQNTPHL